MFFVPLTVLTVSLLYGFTPTMVAIFGAVAVIVVSWLRRDTRLGPIAIWNALAETTFRMVPVAGATAAAGLVIAGITMTGLASKFAHVVYAITSANHFLTLIVGGALTLVLGCGMPTPSAYILAAVLMGPLMSQLGVELLAGHVPALFRRHVGDHTAGCGRRLCRCLDRRRQSDDDCRARGKAPRWRLSSCPSLRVRTRALVEGPALEDRRHVRNRHHCLDTSGSGDRTLFQMVRELVDARPARRCRIADDHTEPVLDRRRRCARDAGAGHELIARASCSGVIDFSGSFLP